MTTVDPANDPAPLHGATLPQALVRFFSNSFRIRGRASRSEYWWWMLVNVVILGVLQFAIPALFRGGPRSGLLFGPFGSAFASIELFTWRAGDTEVTPLLATVLTISGIWVLLTLIPGVTVAVRRLHDSNLSGWWALLGLIPIGQLVMLGLAVRRSRPEGARFDEPRLTR